VLVLFYLLSRKLVFPRLSEYIELPENFSLLKVNQQNLLKGDFGLKETNKITSKAILFCHGNYGNITYHFYRMQMISEYYQDYDIYSFDYVGYGSTKGFLTYTNFYKPGIEAYNTLCRDYQEVILIGESLGGAAAIALLDSNQLIRQPQKTIIINTFTSLKDLMIKVLSPIVPKQLKFLLKAIPYLRIIGIEINTYERLKSVKDKYPNLKIDFISAESDNLIPSSCSQDLQSLSSSYKYISTRGNHNNYDMTFLSSAELVSEACK
jgi:hypothetical protein